MKTVDDLLEEDRLWTVPEAARFLGVSTSWVYKRASDGTLPVVMLGNRVRFEPAQLREYVRANSRGVRSVAGTVRSRTS